MYFVLSICASQHHSLMHLHYYFPAWLLTYIYRHSVKPYFWVFGIDKLLLGNCIKDQCCTLVLLLINTSWRSGTENTLPLGSSPENSSVCAVSYCFSLHFLTAMPHSHVFTCLPTSWFNISVLKANKYSCSSISLNLAQSSRDLKKKNWFRIKNLRWDFQELDLLSKLVWANYIYKGSKYLLKIKLCSPCFVPYKSILAVHELSKNVCWTVSSLLII